MLPPVTAREIQVTQNIDRRSFLTAAAGGLVVISLGGCTSDTVDGKKRPHYVMVFDQNKCVGCGECKRACNEANHLTPGRSRVLLQRMPGPDRHYIRVSCQQCVDSPCVKVCPTGACHHDPETNIVTMNTDRCVGCKYCIAACPYNARWINPETKVADNCDFSLIPRTSPPASFPGALRTAAFMRSPSATSMIPTPSSRSCSRRRTRCAFVRGLALNQPCGTSPWLKPEFDNGRRS